MTMLTCNIVMSKCEIIMLIYDFNYVVCVNLLSRMLHVGGQKYVTIMDQYLVMIIRLL